MCLIGGSPGSGASALYASQAGCPWRIDPRVFLASEGSFRQPQPLEAGTASGHWRLSRSSSALAMGIC